ncbi:hypothetical protein J4050_08445 [Winogradskyella sp. DF17]|uniref:Right handed beta helix domain-containing protein n=1 Tax=Winogradskyella pelagia TaxID=2819984 RepID=A0ABS3T201_9FLAO|nr:hypothetical protein [Winogradskyella sp. DF17]MBO3116773.1 hypothetical protein [Winogradskyella sp. DF17]
MKTIYTFFLVVLCSTLTINAQKVVAVHSPTNGVQYFSDSAAFQEAYDASIAGDTIYLPGGTHTPPSVFDKQLTIFGAGHHPDATTATFETKISGQITLGENADGIHLEGLYITSNLVVGNTNDVSVNDIVVKRCRFGNIYSSGITETNTSNNNLFVENIINSIYDGNNLRSSSFFNNIIVSGNRNTSLTDLYFSNNVFLYEDINGTIYGGFTFYNCVLQNNIFVNQGPALSYGADSTFENNIFCHSAPSLGTDPTLVNNYNLTRAEVLVDQTGGAFDYAHDYHLQAGAATNLGTDGTETGIYGGVYPWKDYSIPTNPHISSKTISGASDSSGNIQVDINVHAQGN